VVKLFSIIEEMAAAPEGSPTVDRTVCVLRPSAVRV